MILGRVTAKSQTTIPGAVRLALGLKAGDRLAYEIVEDRAVLRRAPTTADPFVTNLSTFSEWASERDRVGYANL